MATSEISTPTVHRKIALVIGNQNYTVKPLINSENDANDLAKALHDIGFEVELGINLKRQQIVDLIDAFTEKIQQQDLVFFYFAGHGFQHKEQNYLLPVDAAERITREEFIKNHAINAQDTLKNLSTQTSYVTIFILDCCREYLFDDSTRYRGFSSSSRGLHQMSAPGGTLVQFACAPGTLAADGDIESGHGLFTKHLLKQIIVPNKGLDKIFAAVTAGVYEESGRNQIPFRVSSIMIDEDIYLHTINQANDPSPPAVSSMYSKNEFTRSKDHFFVCLFDPALVEHLRCE
jgi:uncharacterized caspase-like protein